MSVDVIVTRITTDIPLEAAVAAVATIDPGGGAELVVRCEHAHGIDPEVETSRWVAYLGASDPHSYGLARILAREIDAASE